VVVAATVRRSAFRPANAIRLDYRTTSKVCLVTLSALYGHFVVVVVVVSAIVDVDDQQKATADVAGLPGCPALSS